MSGRKYDDEERRILSEIIGLRSKIEHLVFELRKRRPGSKRNNIWAAACRQYKRENGN